MSKTLSRNICIYHNQNNRNMVVSGFLLLFRDTKTMAILIFKKSHLMALASLHFQSTSSLLLWQEEREQYRHGTREEANNSYILTHKQQ